MADIIYHVSLFIAILGGLLAVIRFLMGPAVVSRVVAFDTLTVITISVLVYIAWFLERVIYIDVAVVYALLSFLGVIAVARYLERGL